jgi:multidrug transporter EmrE-like cation transporter
VRGVIAGLALAAAAAACFEAGYVLQALEARASAGVPAPRLSLLAGLARRRTWVLGIVLAAVGACLQALALLLAPVSAVQPTLALGLVLLLGLARRVLGEPIGSRERAGAALIVAGVTVVALCAPERDPGGGSPAAVGATMLALGAVGVGPHLLRRCRAGIAVAAAAAGDVWAAMGLKLAADAVSAGRLAAAAAWAIGCAIAAVLALAAEASALQRVAASRAGPIIVASQVAVPVLLAPLLFGEAWSGTPAGGVALGAGLAGVTAGVAVLAGSRPAPLLAGARSAGEPLEDHVGCGR